MTDTHLTDYKARAREIFERAVLNPWLTLAYSKLRMPFDMRRVKRGDTVGIHNLLTPELGDRPVADPEVYYSYWAAKPEVHKYKLGLLVSAGRRMEFKVVVRPPCGDNPGKTSCTVTTVGNHLRCSVSLEETVSEEELLRQMQGALAALRLSCV